MARSKNVKKRARELGFDLVGITTAEPFHRAYKYLQQRKKQNTLPAFMNSNIKKITQPRTLLPEAKSIICTGISYVHNIPDDEDVFISRYARSRDYHDIVKEKLSRLVHFLKKSSDKLKYKIVCDDDPLLEREAAYRSGLGWYGKNTVLLNKKYGSYFFLGEIITNIKLAPDKSVSSRCGECIKCLKNCAGQALAPNTPYYLDHRGCISSLTQKKGILSEAENIRFSNHIWGCDRCQEVCPFNEDIPENIHPEFTPVIEPAIQDIINFNRKQKLPEKWRNTALSWRGTRILQRNALIAAGNMNYKKHQNLISNKTRSKSPVIKHYAERALKLIQQKQKK